MADFPGSHLSVTMAYEYAPYPSSIYPWNISPVMFSSRNNSTFKFSQDNPANLCPLHDQARADVSIISLSPVHCTNKGPPSFPPSASRLFTPILKSKSSCANSLRASMSLSPSAYSASAGIRATTEPSDHVSTVAKIGPCLSFNGSGRYGSWAVTAVSIWASFTDSLVVMKLPRTTSSSSTNTVAGPKCSDSSGIVGDTMRICVDKDPITSHLH